MKWVGILLLVLLVQFKANSQVYYPICPGESYTLTAQSGLNNYQWYSISGIDTTAIPGAANMSFTTSAPGTYIWKANNNSGCIVSLCEPVLIVTGTCLLPPDTVYQICPDETYTLVAQTGLSDYQWFTLSGTTETMIPGATNISYIANAPGTYLWTAKDANNCLVKLCTPVQINASTSCAMCPDTTYQICPGESYTLTALAGMASYEWYTIVGSDTLVIAGETNISYITSNAGTYIWKAKDVNGCDVSLCCPVKIVPGTACMPCPDTPYEICPGESYTLTAQAGLSNYQWYTISGTDTTAISGATNLTYTATTIGTYIWKATDANGCEVKLCCPVVIKEGNCIIPCAMGPVTAIAGACNPLTNEYSVSGTVTFTNPPSTGTLTVTSGTKSQTFTAPFASPISYTLSGLVSDGLSHTVTAVFSADPNCTGSATYTAPVACECDKTQYEICPGESYTLTAQAGLSNYQWYTISGTDTTAISGATKLTYTTTTIGTYIWKATDANGCEVKLCCPVVIKPGNCLPCVTVTAIAENCASPEGKYSLTGVVTFQTPPASGDLVIKVGPHTIIVPAPVTSPYAYVIPDLPADGAVHTVTAYFTGNPDCVDTKNYTAPLKRCVPLQVIKN